MMGRVLERQVPALACLPTWRCALRCELSSACLQCTDLHAALADWDGIRMARDEHLRGSGLMPHCLRPPPRMDAGCAGCGGQLAAAAATRAHADARRVPLALAGLAGAMRGTGVWHCWGGGKCDSEGQGAAAVLDEKAGGQGPASMGTPRLLTDCT